MPILNTRVEIKAQDQDGNPVDVAAGVGLEKIGPRMQVTISPLEEHVKALADKGEAVPQPVAGQALIDTGASSTCIDRATAEAAGLAVVDSGPMTSATHADEIVPIFAGKLDIAGLPNDITMHRAYGANLAPQGLIALIGRDALKSCVLVYNGPDGSFSLSL